MRTKLDKAISRVRKTEGDASEPASTGLAVKPEVRAAAMAAVPEGYLNQSSDVVGFWQPDGPALHFIPVECRMLDSTLDGDKTSTLVIGRLVKPLELVTGDGVVADGKPGDMVGVWARPGMAALANLANVEVYMFLDSFKDVGKPSPMAVFAVMSKKKGDKLPVAKDARNKSRASQKDALGLLQAVS